MGKVFEALDELTNAVHDTENTMMPNNEAVYEAQGKTMEKVNVLPEERTTALLSDWPTIHDLSVAMRADSWKSGA